MALTYYQLADLATATLFHDRKKKITNIDPTLLRSYPWCNRICRQNVVQEQGGKDIRWTFNFVGNTNAQNIGAFHTRTRVVNDHLGQATMQTKITTNDYSFDTGEEQFNNGEWEIVSHIKNREQQAKIGLTAKIEAQGWGAATTAETLAPQGLLYWLPYCSGNGDFVGTGPTGFTTNIAGLNPATYTGLKSWGGAYVAVSDSDLFLKMRNAWIDTNFQAPLNPMIVMDDVTHQWALYAGKVTVLEFEDRAKQQNDNIGNDLSYFSGRAMFSRTPITEVPFLNTTANSFSTRNPVFGVNWGAAENRVRKGEWMRQERVAQDADQPRTVSFDIYCENQVIFTDRRQGGFNLAKA